MLLQWQSTLRTPGMSSTMDKGVRHACLRIVQIHVHHARKDKAVFRGGLSLVFKLTERLSPMLCIRITI